MAAQPGGPLFRHPLHRDPLVVGWAVLTALGAFLALDANTTWGGHVEADRVGGFVVDAITVLLWTYMALLAVAWLRLKLLGGPAARRPEGHQPFTALPFTDRWLRDWREEQAHLPMPQFVTPDDGCRHGPVGSADRAPMLRALSVSNAIVVPGSDVQVTWCFAGARSVIVDGVPGHGACGELRVPVPASRRIEVVGVNGRGRTAATTPMVVAADLPALDLRALTPPTVALHAQVGVSAGTAGPLTAQLDHFFARQDQLRPSAPPQTSVIGVPAWVSATMRRAGARTEV